MYDRLFKNKNDYSVKVYIHKPGYQKAVCTMELEYVHRIYYLANWLKDWDYLVIFCRRNKQFMKIQTRNEYIEDKPLNFNDNRYNLQW